MTTRLTRALLAALLALGPASALAIELVPADLSAPAVAPLPSAAAALATPPSTIAAPPTLSASAAPTLDAAAADAPGARPAGSARAAGFDHASAAARRPAALGAALFDGAAARDALERARGPDYAVRVMTRRQDGAERVVVLLGESHIKSPAAAELGRAVIARFQVYGLEGYQNKSRGARAFLDRMTAFRRRAAQAQPERYGAGSTIDEAAILNARRRAREQATRRYLDSLNERQRRALLEEAEAAVARGQPGTIGLVAGSGETLLDAAGLRAALSPRAAPAPTPAAFRLEDGHRPGLGERLVFYGPSVRRALNRFAWGAIAASLVWGSGTAHAALAAALLGLNWVWLGDLLPARVLQGPLGALFPLRTGLTRGRDKTMAKNLAAASASPSGAAPILAVVGADHVPGIARLLAREHGFIPADLDALSPR